MITIPLTQVQIPRGSDLALRQAIPAARDGFAGIFNALEQRPLAKTGTGMPPPAPDRSADLTDADDSIRSDAGEAPPAQDAAPDDDNLIDLAPPCSDACLAATFRYGPAVGATPAGQPERDDDAAAALFAAGQPEGDPVADRVAHGPPSTLAAIAAPPMDRDMTGAKPIPDGVFAAKPDATAVHRPVMASGAVTDRRVPDVMLWAVAGADPLARATGEELPDNARARGTDAGMGVPRQAATGSVRPDLADPPTGPAGPDAPRSLQSARPETGHVGVPLAHAQGAGTPNAGAAGGTPDHTPHAGPSPRPDAALNAPQQASPAMRPVLTDLPWHSDAPRPPDPGRAAQPDPAPVASQIPGAAAYFGTHSRAVAQTAPATVNTVRSGRPSPTLDRPAVPSAGVPRPKTMLISLDTPQPGMVIAQNSAPTIPARFGLRSAVAAAATTPLGPATVQVVAADGRDRRVAITDDALVGALRSDVPPMTQAAPDLRGDLRLNAHAPDLSRQIAQRVIDAPDQAAGPGIEIRLSPDELGPVRLTLRSVEGQMTVTVAVERPETLDLMRRHADQLQQDLRSLGYLSVRLDMQAQGDRRAPPPERWPGAPTDTPAAPQAAIPVPAVPLAAVGPAGGLDLRI